MKKTAGKIRLRVVAHIDLDCAYCQFERDILPGNRFGLTNHHPQLRRRPLAVVQYNSASSSTPDLPPDGNRVLATGEGNDQRVHNCGLTIAVSYEARALGVKRGMRAAEAVSKCPGLALVQVPTRNGKADLTFYREIGDAVCEILSRGASATLKASIDECYVDISEECGRRLAALQQRNSSGGSGDSSFVDLLRTVMRRTHVAGDDSTATRVSRSDIRNGYAQSSGDVVSSSSPEDGGGLVDEMSEWWQRPLHCWNEEDKLLVCGASVVAELRAAVREQLGLTVSAGIAHNKLLAKLCSGLHKPAKQTVAPGCRIAALLRDLPVKRLPSLGGQLGERVQTVGGFETVGQLAAQSEVALIQRFGAESGARLWQLAHGLDDEPVENRTASKSIGCGKTFPSSPLATWEAVTHWISQFSRELAERLFRDRRDNRRLPQTMSVGIGTGKVMTMQDRAPEGKNHRSRSAPIRLADKPQLFGEGAQHVASAATDGGTGSGNEPSFVPAWRTDIETAAAALVRRWASDSSSSSSLSSSSSSSSSSSNGGSKLPSLITTLYISLSNFVTIESSTITNFFSATSPSAALPPPPSSSTVVRTKQHRRKDKVRPLDGWLADRGGGGGAPPARAISQQQQREGTCVDEIVAEERGNGNSNVDSQGGGGSAWSCLQCTFCHDGDESSFLLCAVCGAQRPQRPKRPRASLPGSSSSHKKPRNSKKKGGIETFFRQT